MREWLEPMGLRGAMKVSNVPLYQELVRRLGLLRQEAMFARGCGQLQGRRGARITQRQQVSAEQTRRAGQ